MNDLRRLEILRKETLATFLEYLKDLSENRFSADSDSLILHLERAIPHFPSDQQEELRAIVQTAYAQERYLRAKQEVDVLEAECPQRERAIAAFLEKYYN